MVSDFSALGLVFLMGSALGEDELPSSPLLIPFMTEPPGAGEDLGWDCFTGAGETSRSSEDSELLLDSSSDS